MTKKEIVYLSAFLINVAALLYIAYHFYQKSEASAAQLRTEMMSNLTVNKYADSLLRTNLRYEKYRHAGESQAYRDSVVRKLQFVPGDIVYKKLDSARVLVTDLVIGGGKFDYYFRYKVQHSDGKEEELKPELLVKDLK